MRWIDYKGTLRIETPLKCDHLVNTSGLVTRRKRMYSQFLVEAQRSPN